MTVCGHVEEGRKRRNARLIFGGLPPKDGPLGEGYFAISTVFADASNDWRLAREEIFGPALVAIPWKDEADAIRMADDSHYGLAAIFGPTTPAAGCGRRTRSNRVESR